jgi:hypothetical protein
MNYFIVIGVAASLLVLHLVLRWLDRRGKIVYRLASTRPSGIGSAFMELNALARPSMRHVIQAQRDAEVRRVDDASGEPPSSEVAPPTDDFWR